MPDSVPSRLGGIKMAPDLSTWSDADLHRAAYAGYANSEQTGQALAEVERRRRAFESSLAQRREDHDFKMLEGRGRLNAVQQEFDERLAREGMAHAEKLAAKQIEAAQMSAKATARAAWAAGFSAIGALISGVVALLSAKHWLGF